MNKQFCAKSNTPRNLCRLGDVATYINGYAFAPADWDTKGLPIIRIQDLTGNPYQANYFSGEIDGRFKVHSGDILISWSASLGIFERHGGDAVLNQHIFKVVFDKIGIEKNFFVHQLRMLLARFASEAHGATMKHLTRPIFNALPFYAPPMGEQKRISSILESISSMISIHRRQLCKIDQLAKSRFIEMFGDPVTNPCGHRSAGSARCGARHPGRGSGTQSGLHGGHIHPPAFRDAECRNGSGFRCGPPR